jgi:hypothetical protein
MDHPGAPPPSSKRQEMRDAVHQVLQKVADDRQAATVEAQAAAARAARKRRRHRTLLALGIVALVAAIVFAVPRWRRPFPAPTGAEADRQARIALLFAARAVDGFRDSRGRLPLSLQETGVALPGVSYTPDTDGWELSTVVEGRTLTLRHSDDRDAFQSATPASPP